MRWLEQLAAQIGRDIHRTASDLRPTAIDDLGIFRAIEAYAAEWQERYDVRVDIQTFGRDRPLPPEMIPQRLFDRLFGSKEPYWIERKKSILDAVSDEARSLIAVANWSAALVDVHLGDQPADGLALLRELRRDWPHRHCSAVTGAMDAAIDNAVYAIGCGLLKKTGDFDDLLQAFLLHAEDHVDRLARRFGLTGQETHLCRELFAGCSLRDAAKAMGIGVATAKTYVRSILRKTSALGAKSIRQLQVIVLEGGRRVEAGTP